MGNGVQEREREGKETGIGGKGGRGSGDQGIREHVRLRLGHIGDMVDLEYWILDICIIVLEILEILEMGDGRWEMGEMGEIGDGG